MTEIQNNVGEIKKDCGACFRFQNRKPVPATLIPKVTKHNQIVTIDLKEWGEGKYRYIVYAIDKFSRLTVGEFIEDKRAEKIGKFLLTRWIVVFGRMLCLHSDRGGRIYQPRINNFSRKFRC